MKIAAEMRSQLHLSQQHQRQNGGAYAQALDSFDEALKLNPKNEMARQLAERFRQGMGEQAK